MNQLELTSRFFRGKRGNSTYGEMCLDLYRAITCYRMYDGVSEFMKLNPELESSREDVKELWDEFDKLTEENLADVALALLSEF